MWMDIAQEGDHEPRSDEEDTVYDRSNPFHSKRAGDPESELELRTMIDEPETRCGIGSWRPIYLQKFAKKSVFSLIFATVAVVHGSFWSYYTTNISTYEKRFRMDSVTSGILVCTNELAQFLIAIIFTYMGFRRHRAKLLTLGVALSSVSCFLMASPHYFLGQGQMATELMEPKYAPFKSSKLSMELNGGNMSMEIGTLGVTKSTFISTVDGSMFDTEEHKLEASMTTQALKNASVSSTQEFKTPARVTKSEESKLLETSTSTPSTKGEGSLTTEFLNMQTKAQDMIPLINDEMKHSWPMCTRHTENIDSDAKGKRKCELKVHERRVTFALIFCANFVGGVGSMLYLLSGGPFAEDSTILPNELPRIFGITMAIRLIGAFFGYLFAWSCLSEFVHPLMDISQTDARWLGAYWLGWTCLGIFMAFFTLVFSLFPRQAPKEFLKKRSLTQEAGLAMYLIPNNVPFFQGSELKAANPFPAILSIGTAAQGLLRNKIYMLLTLSAMTNVFFSVGYLTFLPKYLEFVFRLKAGDAAVLTGLSNVPFQVAGLMLGGAFISRYLPSPKEISHWNAIASALKIVGLTIMAFLGCSASKIDLSFLASKDANATDQHCSTDCDCVSGPMLPVCDLYSSTNLYSPCHAGCEKVENLTHFTHCSCLPSENVRLVEGFCPSDNCANGLIAFLVFVCLIQFLNGSGVVGRMLISYKSLQADQRSLVIGLTLLLLSLFATIPSPIAFGSLFESACLVREEMCDDSAMKGNCWLYKEASLRFAFNLSSAAILMLAFLFDVMLWKIRDIQDLRIYDGELRQLVTSQAQSPTNQPENFSPVPLS